MLQWEESQWGKIVTLRSLDRYYKGGSHRGRGGSPGGSTRRTVNVRTIPNTHSDNELFEPVNFRLSIRSYFFVFVIVIVILLLLLLHNTTKNPKLRAS